MPRGDRARQRLAAAAGEKRTRTRPRRYRVGTVNLNVRVTAGTLARLRSKIALGDRGQFVEEAVNEKLDRATDAA